MPACERHIEATRRSGAWERRRSRRPRGTARADHSWSPTARRRRGRGPALAARDCTLRQTHQRARPPAPVGVGTGLCMSAMNRWDSLPSLGLGPHSPSLSHQPQASRARVYELGLGPHNSSLSHQTIPGLPSLGLGGRPRSPQLQPVSHQTTPGPPELGSTSRASVPTAPAGHTRQPQALPSSCLQAGPRSTVKRRGTEQGRSATRAELMAAKGHGELRDKPPGKRDH